MDFTEKHGMKNRWNNDVSAVFIGNRKSGLNLSSRPMYKKFGFPQNGNPKKDGANILNQPKNINQKPAENNTHITYAPCPDRNSLILIT